MKSLFFSGLFLPLVLGSLALACSVPGVGEEDAASSGELNDADKKLPVDRLLDDEDIVGGGGITTADVQKFLDGKDSFLATYKEEGKLAAEIIVERSREKGVSPVYMLARIQGESSLVESKSPRSSLVEKATGCGCPDGKGCSAEFKGFANQITCAANLITKYFTQMKDDGKTVSGWAVGTEKKTLDPCTVTPKNKATAALYTYTPWVGAHGQGCGSSKWMGSSGMAVLTLKYKESFSPSKLTGTGTGTGTGTATPFCETAAGREDPSCTSIGPVQNCPPAPASQLCNAASVDRSVECGMISDGCGGFVNCDNVTGFGCGASQSCTSNRCSATACIPRPTGELCGAARSQQGVECGLISDGCGGSVNCDVVATFGCKDSVCTPLHKCEKKVTTPPPVDPPKTDPPTSSPSTDPPRDPDTSSPSSPASGDDDNDDDTTEGDGKEPTKSNQKKPKKKAAGGCSAAPGSDSSPGSGGLAGLGLALGLAFARRRRSRRIVKA
jgi:MYXO-CTERM domain-containing protein